MIQTVVGLHCCPDVRLLVRVLDFGDFGVFPKGLKAIERPDFGLKDVHDYVSVVNCDPLPAFHADGSVVAFAKMLQHVLDQSARNAGYLGGGTAVADDEIIEGRFFHPAHVDNLDVVSLAVLKTFNNRF